MLDEEVDEVKRKAEPTMKATTEETEDREEEDRNSPYRYRSSRLQRS